ncbi:MAG: hypothetical protein QW342_06735 [Thermoproteota archaeon]
MKLSKVLKKAATAIVAGVVTNSIADSIFPRKGFSLFPTLSTMGALIFSNSSNYSLYKKVLFSNLVYTIACLTEFRLGISLVSLPFFIAMLPLFVSYDKVNTTRRLIAVSNFPRLEKVYSESELKKKVSILKEKAKSLEVSIVHREDLILYEQIIRTTKFIAYKKDNYVKLVYEYSENFPSFRTKSIKRMQDGEVDTELILNEIYDKALSIPPPLTLPFDREKIQVPSSYSRGKLLILDQEGKINLYDFKKVNEKNGWIELGKNQLINFVKSKLFPNKATFFVGANGIKRTKVDLIVLIQKDFHENEVGDTIISVPRHSEKLSRYLGFENLEPFNENLILYNKDDGLIFLTKGGKK